MIPEDLLFAKGTGIGIVSLAESDAAVTDLEAVAAAMNLSEGTARKRIEQLQNEHIIEETAELVDGEPTSVFSLTDAGQEAAEHLGAVIE